jgi:hypothetical protein
MKNFRPFRVTFTSPTNHRGARVRIQDLRQGTRIFLSYDYAIGDIKEQAAQHLASIGIPSTASALADIEKGYIILSDNFKIELTK